MGPLGARFISGTPWDPGPLGAQFISGTLGRPGWAGQAGQDGRLAAPPAMKIHKNDFKTKGSSPGTFICKKGAKKYDRAFNESI